MDSFLLESGECHSDQEPIVAANKFRIRFRKSGDMRFISHHDLMHCVERLFRRADLALETTKGFHPKPRIVFPLSLSLGIAGLNEVMEVQTEQPMTADALIARLAPHVLTGMTILSARPLPPKSSGRVSHVGYRLNLPTADAEALPHRIAILLEQPEWWVRRIRPNPRMLDLRPAIKRLEIADQHLEMELWVFANGTPRPQEILQLLDLKRLTDDGAVLERYILELMDEQCSPPTQPLGELPVRKLTKHQTKALSDSSEETKEISSSEMLISGPLSFNS